MGLSRDDADRWLRSEMGDPVLIESDFVIGVHRDGDGHVQAVKISSMATSIEFNRTIDERRPGLKYHGGSLDADETGAAIDLDGDARMDELFLFRKSAEPHGVILARVGERFIPARGLDKSRLDVDGVSSPLAFDRTTHAWVNAASTRPNPSISLIRPLAGLNDLYGMFADAYSHETRERRRREYGLPLVVDVDLLVAVARDDAGKVARVTVDTHLRTVEFARFPDQRHPALYYVGGEIASVSDFASAIDFDGDGRLDLCSFVPRFDDARPATMLRIGEAFVRAQPLGEGRFRREDNAAELSFDFTARRWVAVATTRPATR